MAMRRGGLSLVLGALAVALLCIAAQAQNVIVVANQDVTISEVTDTELRDLFTGSRTRFHDGSRAVPALLKGGPAHEVFLHHYIGGTSDSFRANWRKAVFTGQGAAPKEFASEAALLQYIAVTAGAMGYVSHLGTGEKVKVLLVRSTNAKDTRAVGR
jgi:hypothetical protein